MYGQLSRLSKQYEQPAGPEELAIATFFFGFSRVVMESKRNYKQSKAAKSMEHAA